jgi:hypothetical protein
LWGKDEDGGIALFINNMAEWAWENKYVVFRIVDGKAWFYDAWNDYKKALNQAIEEDGQIIPISEIVRGM